MRVFITGCGSGFGRLLTQRLLTLDRFEVIATDPDPAGLALLSGARTCVLDIRDGAHVARVAEEIGPVDVVVNNAGFAVFATQEEADLDAVSDLFDVNVIGAARVTKAFLPGLRERQGTVVQISSISGRTVLPESGFYAATKYALEAMTEALFQEAGPFGVKFRLIEPGNFATRFQAHAQQASRPRSPHSPYAPLHDLWDERREDILAAPQDPNLVVDAIVQSLDDPRPFARIPVGEDAERILDLKTRLGPDAWSRLAADRNGLDGPHFPGEVLDPRGVLEAADDDDDLALTRAAHAAGHLSHWGETPLGRQALARLRTLPAP